MGCSPRSYNNKAFLTSVWLHIGIRTVRVKHVDSANYKTQKKSDGYLGPRKCSLYKFHQLLPQMTGKLQMGLSPMYVSHLPRPEVPLQGLAASRWALANVGNIWNGQSTDLSQLRSIPTFWISVSAHKTKECILKIYIPLWCKSWVVVLPLFHNSSIETAPKVNSKATLGIWVKQCVTCFHGNDANITSYLEMLSWETLYQIAVHGLLSLLLFMLENLFLEGTTLINHAFQ